MKFEFDSAINESARYYWKDFGGNIIPWEFTGPRDEFMATRTTAALGVFLNSGPAYDIGGPDAGRFLNDVCVNRDITKMTVGGSKHGLICNDKGQLLGSGVIIKNSDNSFRTYWLTPVIQYFLETSSLDVNGRYRTDEYFFQIDGPKSLEILEKACQCDLHDISFGRNKRVTIGGTDMVVHRLGMSGALAYEVHGAAQHAEEVYKKLRQALFEYGGKLQGARNYTIILHTPGGYPNQHQHFWYPYLTSGKGLAEFTRPFARAMQYCGSASDNEENFFSTPFDLNWGYLVGFDKKKFMGREALLEISKNVPRKMVTLEWNTEDVGDVFMSQFRGKGIEPFEQIEHTTTIADASQGAKLRGDYVLADGKQIGVATGKTYAFYERRMISLASIDKEYAAEETEVVVLWGTPGTPQKEIRAKVARFPYYNGEYRNETFDVEKIPHPTF